MAVSQGSLIVGGEFRGAGGLSIPNLARWDGVAWHSFEEPSGWSRLGSGVSDYGTVLALATYADDLYVGGLFLEAGGKSSHFIARWTNPPLVRFAHAPAEEQGRPVPISMQNPYHAGGEIRLAPISGGAVELAIYSATGRRVRSLLPDLLGSGWRGARWDGRSDTGTRVGSGVYYLQARVGETGLHRSFVLIK